MISVIFSPTPKSVAFSLFPTHPLSFSIPPSLFLPSLSHFFLSVNLDVYCIISTPLANVRLSDSSQRRCKMLFSAVYVYKMYLLNLLPNYWFWLCPSWTSWKTSYCSLNGWHDMILLQPNIRKTMEQTLRTWFPPHTEPAKGIIVKQDLRQISCKTWERVSNNINPCSV